MLADLDQARMHAIVFSLNQASVKNDSVTWLPALILGQDLQ